MNKFLLSLNIVLLLAVGFLFYLYFDYIHSDQHRIKQAEAAVSNSFKIAYFDSDSLQNQYTLYKEAREYLRNKEAQVQQELNAKKNEYITKVKEYNQKGPTMSQADQSAFQQVLLKMQNDFEEKKQELGQDMQSEQMRKLLEVKTRIQQFLRNYCKDKGYAYVFASDENDYLYYKDTVRNITPDIVRLLNEDYKNTKNK